MPNKREIFLLCWLCLAVIVFSAHILNHNARKGELSQAEQKDLINIATKQGTWIKSEIQGSRSVSYSRYDATDEYIYFTYPDDYCVDVYDVSGLFRYSLYLPYFENGSIGVRCIEGKTYIKSHNGTIYIFEGDQCISTINDSEERIRLGYHGNWFFFDLSETGIKITKDQIQHYADDGTLLFQCPTPAMIHATIPIISAQVLPVMLLCIFGILFCFIIVLFVRKLRT